MKNGLYTYMSKANIVRIGIYFLSRIMQNYFNLSPLFYLQGPLKKDAQKILPEPQPAEA